MKILLVYVSVGKVDTIFADDISVYTIEQENLPKVGDEICPSSGPAYSGNDTNLYRVLRVVTEYVDVYGHQAVVYAEHLGHKLI